MQSTSVPVSPDPGQDRARTCGIVADSISHQCASLETFVARAGGWLTFLLTPAVAAAVSRMGRWPMEGIDWS